jgi:HEAT repeat protein
LINGSKGCAAVVCVLLFCAIARGQQFFEELPTLVEIQPNYIEQFDSPKDSDPAIPAFRHKQVYLQKQLSLWSAALERREADMRSMVAESMLEAHRAGRDDLGLLFDRLIAVFSDPSTESITVESIAVTLTALGNDQAADAFYARAAEAQLPLAKIIEPALAHWQDKRLEPVWLKRVGDDHVDSQRRRLAIEALSTIQSVAALPELLKLVTAKYAPVTLRLSAAKGIGAFDAPSVLPVAAQLAGKGRGTLIDRILAAEMLATQNTTAAKELLTSLCQDENDAVSSLAATNLFAIDPDATRQIRNQLVTSRNATVRSVAAKSLSHNATEDDIRVLIRMFSDPDPNLRDWVREDLVKKASTEPFRKMVIDETREIVRSGDAAGDWRSVEQAIRCLGLLEFKPAAQDIVPHLKATRINVYLSAAWALRKIAATESLADCLQNLDELVKGIDTDTIINDQYRESQISQLCQLMGILKYEPAIPLMRTFVPKAKIARGEHARAAAIWSLGHLYADNPQKDLAQELVARLQDEVSLPPESASVRAASAVAIARMGEKSSGMALLKYADPEGEVGYSCAWGLNKLAGVPIPESPVHERKEEKYFLTPATAD